MQTLKTSIKLNRDSFITICFFLAFMIPYFSYKGRGYVLPFAIFAIWLINVFLKTSKLYKLLHGLSLRKLELLFLSIFYLITLFTYFFITPTVKAFQYTLMPITYFFLLCIDAFYFRKNEQYKLSIFFVIVLILGLQAAISIPYILSSENMVSRLYTSGELKGGALEEAFKNGVGSANLYTNLCGVFFLGFGMLSKFNNKLMKSCMIISLICILFSIVSSSYSLPILMLLTGGLIFLLRLNWTKLKLSRVFASFLLICVLIFFYNSFLASSNLVEPVERKIQIIRQGNLKEDGRMELAAVSMNTFSNNPIWGVGVPDWGSHKQIGEHLPWIDFLAHYGFLGFLPFIAFLIILYTRNYKFYLKSPKSNIYATSCLIGATIFVLSNFIDPLIFDAPVIIMLLFFYASMDNWGNKPIANFST